MLRDFSDPEAAKLLFNEVRDEDRLVMTTVHAKERRRSAAANAAAQGAAARILPTIVTAVLCTRLIRKLCDACKVAYAPTPDLLKKLGIPAGQGRSPVPRAQAGGNRKAVQGMRRPRLQRPHRDCSSCWRSTTRFARFWSSKPQLELLRKAARAAGMRPFQEEGLLLVAKGVTSLAELQRVLKEK